MVSGELGQGESAAEEPWVRIGVGGFVTEPEPCLPVLTTLPPMSDKVGDGLYLQTPSAPFHIVSIAKDGQMNALGVNKLTLLVLSFPRS